MKKILILAAAAAVLCSCGNKNKYTVEGTVAGANDKVYLLDEEDTVLDSAVVKNGKFRLSGIAEAPAVAILRDARDQGATFAAMLILEPGRITVSDDAENAYRKKVTGTPANDASDAYAAASHALVNEFRNEATGEERRAAIEKEYDQLTRTTMEQNRTNLFGALLLAQQLGYELSGQELPRGAATEQRARIAQRERRAEDQNRCGTALHRRSTTRRRGAGGVAQIGRRKPGEQIRPARLLGFVVRALHGRGSPPEKGLRRVPQEGIRNLRRIVRQGP